MFSHEGLQAFAGVGSALFLLIAGIFLLYLAIMGFLMPLFVYRIRSELILMNARINAIMKVAEKLTQNTDS